MFCACVHMDIGGNTVGNWHGEHILLFHKTFHERRLSQHIDSVLGQLQVSNVWAALWLLTGIDERCWSWGWQSPLKLSWTRTCSITFPARRDMCASETTLSRNRRSFVRNENEKGRREQWTPNTTDTTHLSSDWNQGIRFWSFPDRPRWKLTTIDLRIPKQRIAHRGTRSSTSIQARETNAVLLSTNQTKDKHCGHRKCSVSTRG